MEPKDQHFNRTMEKMQDNMVKLTNIISDSIKKIIEWNVEQMSYPLQQTMYELGILPFAN